MKRILSSALLLLSMLSLGTVSSCSFLDENTESVLDIDDMIVDNSSLEYALVGVYSRLRGLYSPGCLAFGEVGTDITRNSKSNANVSAVDSYTVTPSTDAVNTFWYNHYLLIRDANIVISKCKELSGTVKESEILRISSEARFLRAFAYFRLMQVYGEVPLITEPVKTVGLDEFSFKRDSIATIYRFLETELTEVINGNGLKVKDGGRANKWAARALLARIYLYVGTSKQRNEVGTPTGALRGDTGAEIEGGVKDLIPGYDYIQDSYLEIYSKARTLLRAMIANAGFRLTTNFYDPFTISLKNSNSESIWEIQFAEGTDYSSGWSKMFGVRGSGFQSTSAVAGNQAFQPVPSFWRYFKLGDQRRNLYIADYSVVADGDAFKRSAISGTVSLPSSTGINLSFDLSLDAAYDPIYKATCQSFYYDTQLGTEKYAWGSSSDRYSWVTEKMPYLSASECPNNIVVFRYADILLMNAEVEMLLNGASPATPKATGFATKMAIDNINAVVSRAMNGKTYDELLTEYTATYTAARDAAQTAYDASVTAYNKNNTNNNLMLMQKNEILLNNANLQLATVANRVIKPFDSSNLTYEDVIDERARELCFEFNRWFDLQRLGWLKYKVQQRITYYVNTPMPEIVEPKHYLFPLPISDVDLSYNEDFKTNNPGYNN